MGSVSVGVALGQGLHPPVIAVVKAAARSNAGRYEVLQCVRYLEQLPCGTEYSAVDERVAAIVGSVRRQRAPAMLRLYADGTGVGQPVLALLNVAGVRTVGVYVTYGPTRSIRADGAIALGAEWIVGRLQSLLQTGRLLLPSTAEARALADALRTYDLPMDEHGAALVVTRV